MLNVTNNRGLLLFNSLFKLFVQLQTDISQASGLCAQLEGCKIPPRSSLCLDVLLFKLFWVNFFFCHISFFSLILPSPCLNVSQLYWSIFMKWCMQFGLLQSCFGLFCGCFIYLFFLIPFFQFFVHSFRFPLPFG